MTKAALIKKIFVCFAIVIFTCLPAFGGEIRVISLAPNITEILFAIGLGEKEIVGITDYCDYPKEVNKILKIGSLTTVNIEEIIALKPDYVFSAGDEASPLNSRLKGAGLNVTILDPQNINETFSAILAIGRIVNREEAAKKVVSGMRAKLTEIHNKTKAISHKKKIYVEIWDDPITSCGRGSFVDEAVTEAGGINITGSISTPYPAVSQEFIIRENPDFIILGYMARGQKNLINIISKRFGWQGINAVRAKNIITDIDPNLILRPGPRIVDGIEKIYNKVYGNK